MRATARHRFTLHLHIHITAQDRQHCVRSHVMSVRVSVNVRERIRDLFPTWTHTLEKIRSPPPKTTLHKDGKINKINE